MLDLKKRRPDLRLYIHNLEEWIIKTLACFGIKGERRCGRVGIWVDMQPYGGLAGQEAKIAAIGVRIRKWVTYHGVSININPDLAHFSGIVPCGISDHGVTSLADLGVNFSQENFDKKLKESWGDVFLDKQE